jgi:hypothetical protein
MAVEKKEVVRYCKIALEDMHNQLTENEINMRYSKRKQLEGKLTSAEAEKTVETIANQTKNKEKLETLIEITNQIKAENEK